MPVFTKMSYYRKKIHLISKSIDDVIYEYDLDTISIEDTTNILNKGVELSDISYFPVEKEGEIMMDELTEITKRKILEYCSKNKNRW